MSVIVRVCSAAVARLGRILPLVAAGLLPLVMQACSASTASPWRGPDPSDASVRVTPARYHSTVGAYVSQRPVEPRPWRELNERVAPQPKR
jgi:hypothetical protein